MVFSDVLGYTFSTNNSLTLPWAGDWKTFQNFSMGKVHILSCFEGLTRINHQLKSGVFWGIPGIPEFGFALQGFEMMMMHI